MVRDLPIAIAKGYLLYTVFLVAADSVVLVFVVVVLAITSMPTRAGPGKNR